MKRVLVTGAGGFLGRHALPGLRARGFEIHALGRTPPADPGIVGHRADLLDAGSRREAVRSIAASHLLPSVSYTTRRGTVRGMHFSREPHAETKLVRCTRGAIHDVVVDLRPGSATYLRTLAVELTARNRHALYIPAGFAHGFQALRDDTEVLYMIDRPFVAAAAGGLRWNDPAIAVAWPEPVAVIAERDLAFPDWSPE